MIQLIEAWLKRKQEIENAMFEHYAQTGSWKHRDIKEIEEETGERMPEGWQPFVLVFTKKNFKEIRCVNTFERYFDSRDYKRPERYVQWFGWAENANDIRERIRLYNQEPKAKSMHEYYKRFYNSLPLWILGSGDHELSNERL
jgi:hypothetical protein